MSRVAIFPRFKIRQGRLDAFLARVARQRDDCLREEPGCLHFDVLRPEEGGDEVCLYEIYADAEALERHRTYDHYKAFKAETEPWVESLEIGRYVLAD